VLTLAEGEITELRVGLKGTMNALFLKDLADKTRRGLEGRVRARDGQAAICVLAMTSFASTTPAASQFSVAAGSARPGCSARRIFAEFAAGKSPRRIAIDLNRDHIRGPHGGD
jgi:site-specific DNA recombinase